ncbi:MAG TPA: 5-formyltetrahydrofolate cyclo-ligase [Chloroflexaceae bacterium]|nr:5-formyltetrahydrofolate cyclo-ligase [Chloroflexaceae bacterium]
MSQAAGAAERKGQLRREAIARRDALADRAERSAAIRALVMGLEAYRVARAIHCFLAIRSEVDTRPLVAAALAAGKAVAVPVIDGRGVMLHSWIEGLDEAGFERGQLGTASPRAIRPAQPGEWQLTVVPLLAFDRAGYRLGYGKGHYDGLLARGAGRAVGVAFACQEVPELPREAHDIPLDMIVTEAGVIVPEQG